MGRVSVLEDKVGRQGQTFDAHLGIAHTRWATHGKPDDINAHPHQSGNGRLTLIHNGIIENYAALRTWLKDKGHTFKSETDTEVLAVLIGELYEGDLEAALTNFFDAMLGIYYRDSDVAPGCLIFGTAPAHVDEAEIKARLNFGIDQVDSRMRQRMEKAFPNCESSRIETAARMASNTLIAFSARAKAGATRQALSEIGAESAQTIGLLLRSD